MLEIVAVVILGLILLGIIALVLFASACAQDLEAIKQYVEIHNFRYGYTPEEYAEARRRHEAERQQGAQPEASSSGAPQ